MDPAWMEQLVRWNREGRSFSVVTIVESRGSTPAHVGARILVDKDGTFYGTVGGGALEARLLEEGKKALNQGFAHTIELDLLKDLQMTCGGRILAFVEPMKQPDQVTVFGAGHVSRALVPLLVSLGFQVHVIDDRQEWADPGAFPPSCVVEVAAFGEAASRLAGLSHQMVVIMTRDHSNDVPVLRQILPTPPRYVGILASRSTRAHLEAQLREEGLSMERPFVHVPIGLPIGSHSPEEIAVSIAAELIAVRNGVSSQASLRPSPVSSGNGEN